MKTNLITLAVVLAGLALLVAHLWGRLWTPMRIVGAAIGLPSLALFLLARIELGGSFSVHAKAQALVTHGLYSRIRNPIYVFGAFTIAGVLLFAGLPKLLWALAALIPLQVYRARKEEKALAAKFGDEYRAYKAPGRGSERSRFADQNYATRDLMRTERLIPSPGQSASAEWHERLPAPRRIVGHNWRPRRCKRFAQFAATDLPPVISSRDDSR